MITQQTIFAVATDPIYIGTGGYSIGRVDNTIVRDPITNIPKIPATSLAGTWRYYLALKLQAAFKEDGSHKFRSDRTSRKDKKLTELFDKTENWIAEFEGNRFAALKCAGQDDAPNNPLEEKDPISGNATGHCGQCIVCHSFGYAKNQVAKQGRVFLSDLQIIFFPVATRFGVKWVSSKEILAAAGLLNNEKSEEKSIDVAGVYDDTIKDSINLGWLNLKVKKETLKINLKAMKKAADFLDEKKIVLVSDEILAQIINANLEVRTSVSIDPITGTAKDGALFTSEAIPRATIFKGDLRIMEELNPAAEQIISALNDAKTFYESMGIGGMVTRGFGRLKIANLL